MPPASSPNRPQLLMERLENRILLSAATPTAAVDIPTEEFINEDFDFSISFDNSGTDVGFAPYVDIVVPADIDLATATIQYLGTTVTPILTATFDGTEWLDGATPVNVHPLTDATLDGTDALTAGAVAGDQLVIVQLPFGSFAPDQPIAEIEFSGAMLGGSVGTPLDVTARAGFAFGCDEFDNPATDSPSLQAPVASSITPTVIELTKTNDAPEAERPTGANFPVTFTLEVDIATGETIDALVLSDVLPTGVAYVDDLSFVMSDIGGDPTVISEPVADTDAPNLQLDYGSVVGVAGTDLIVTYSYYLPDVIADNNGNNNDDLNFTNMASVTGTHASGAVMDTDDNTISGQLIAVQKGVNLVLDPGANGPTPGDTLEYTLTFQISDFTDFSNIVIDDTLGDGLAFDATFQPTYNISEAGVNTANPFLPANLTTTALGGGLTQILFNISDELVDRGQDGVLAGDIASQNPLLPRGSTGTVTFRATILEDYTNPPGPDPSVDIGDTLGNDVSIGGTTAGGDTEADTSSASVTVTGLTLDKTIYAIDSVVGAPIGAGLFPGQEVTYRITVTLPSADTENLVVTDFLPLPVFDATAVAIFDPTYTSGSGGGAAAPIAGTAKYGPLHTLHTTEQTFITGTPNEGPLITAGAASNRLNFDFGTFDAAPSGPVTVDILFTVRLLDAPFGDGLFLTNQSVSSFGDTGGEVTSNTEIVQIVLNQPELNLTKGVVATNNSDATFNAPVGPVAFNPPGSANPFGVAFDSTDIAATPVDADLIDIDAGDLVTFAIVIENSGGAEAFDVLINDIIPAGFQIAGGGTSFTDANGQVRLANAPATAIGFVEVGSFFSGTDGQGIRINDPANGSIEDRNGPAGSNILVVTYELEAVADINPRTFHENTAHLDEFAAFEGGVDYTDGFERSEYTDVASVETAAPQVTKAFVDSDQAFTAGTDIAFGEIVTYDLVVTLPEGEIPDLTVTDLIHPSMAYVSGTATLITTAAGSINLANTFNGTVSLVSTSSTSNPGADVTFTFDDGGGGDVIVVDDDVSGNNSFVIRFDAVLVGSSGAIGGNAIPNSAVVNFTDTDGATNSGTPGPADTINSNSVNINVVEPNLVITKDIDLTTVDAGDTITVTLSLQNTGTADAFEVVIEDVVDAVRFTSITAGAAPANFTNTSSGNTIQYTADPGFAIQDGTGPIFFTFTAVATGAVTPGETITNTSEITEGVTLPNGVPATDDSRDVSGDTDTDTVDVVLGLDKSIADTSETHTAGNDVAIGEIVRYRLEIEFPENDTDDLQIIDRLPDGMTFLNDGTAMLAFVSNGAGFSAGGALGFGTGPATINGNTAAAGVPAFVLSDQNVSAAAESDNDTYVSGGDIFFRLGDVVNADDDPDSEFIVIEFNALVGNIATNNAGGDLDNDFIITSDEVGANVQIGSDSNVLTTTVQEPTISVAKSITTAANDAGDTIVYDITVTNSGGASGFEVQITDDLDALDAGVFTLVSAVFNPGATGASIIDNTAGNVIDMTIDELGASESITITVTATLANDLVAGREVSNRADGVYTSLPGANGTIGNPTGSDNTGLAGDADGERTGAGGALNDYASTSTINFTTPSPDVDKELFDTTVTDFGVGTSIFYEIHVILPEGVTSSFVLTDEIPVGMAFIGAQLIKTAGAPTGPTDLVSNRITSNYLGTIANEGSPAFNAALSSALGDGADFVLDFGDIDSTATGGTANNAFVVRIEAVILDTGVSGLGGGPTFTNNVQVSYTDPDDGPGGTPATTVIDDPTDPTITLVEPELTIDKSVVVGGGGTSGDAGDSATYTIVVDHTANSTGTAFDLDLSDSLPSEFTPTGFTATTVNLGNVAALFDLTGTIFSTTGDLDLATSDALTITFTGNLNATVAPKPGGSLINNEVTGSYTSADGDQTDKTGGANPNDDEITRNFSDDVDINVPAPTFEKTVISTDEAETVGSDLTIGETTTFGIVLSLPEGNYGEIVITDDIPLGLDFVGGSASVVTPAGYVGTTPTITVTGGAGSGADITLTLSAPFTVGADAIAANNQLTIQYDAIVLASTTGLVSGPPATFVNTAAVTLDDPDNPGTALDVEVTGSPGVTTDSETFSAVEPELQIDKDSVVAQADAGDIVTYSVTISHTADSTGPAFDLVITDDLLEGLGANDKLDLIVGSVTTTFGTIITGNTGGDTTVRIEAASYARTAAPITITYQAQLNINVNAATDTVTNTAEIDYDSHGDSPAEQRTDSLSDDHIIAVPLTQIQFDKAAIATDLGHTASDKLNPALFDLVVGEVVTYRLTTTLIKGTYTDDVVITETLPDFLALVSGGNPRVLPEGADVNLNGPVTFVSTADGFTATIDVDTVALNPGPLTEDQIIIEYDAVVLESDGGVDNFNGNVITNTAELTFATFMTDDSADIEVVEPELLVTKTASDDTPHLGDTITYTIVVEHAPNPAAPTGSGIDAYDIDITDTLHPSLSLVAPSVIVNDTPGGAATGVIVSTVGGVIQVSATSLQLSAAPQGFITITYDAVVTADPAEFGADLTNTVTVNYDGIPGNVPGQKAETVDVSETVTVVGPDLTVTKTDLANVVIAGQTVTYTIEVTNKASATGDVATNVEVLDTIPTGATFVSSPDASFDSLGGGVARWLIPTIAVGDTVTLTALIKIDDVLPPSLLTIENAVTVNNLDDIEPTPADNTATDTSRLDTGPDLQLTKDDGLTTVSPGETITYDITATNAGDQNTTGVMVVDSFPNDILTNVRANTPSGVVGVVVDEIAGTITWDLGQLDVGEVIVLTVTADVRSVLPAGRTDFTNSATISDDGLSGPDVFPGDETASDTDNFDDTLTVPDYVVDKTNGTDRVSPSDVVTYTVTVSNVGVQGGTGIVVTDSFDPRLFASVAASDGGVVDFNAGTITWTLATLAGGGASETFTVTATLVQVPPAGIDSVTNSVAVTDDGSNGIDRDLSNNSAEDTDELAVFVYDGLRNDAFLDDAEDSPFAPLDEIDHEVDPLPIDTLYTGHSEPGTTLVLTLLDENGASIGFQTVIADSGGNWVANFGGTVLTQAPHSMTIEQQDSVINESSMGGFNLRTYFSPATQAPLFFSFTANEDSALANTASATLEAMHNGNASPLALGREDFNSYEFLTSSTTTTQYGN